MVKAQKRSAHAAATLLACCLLAAGGSSVIQSQAIKTASTHAVGLSDPFPTEYGLVRGEVLENSIAFRGIPFAAPPVDELRWRPPERHQGWKLLDAVNYGSSCPQWNLDGSQLIGAEDCLTLNIWAPKKKEPQPRPVMFSIHGGGNIIGSSSSAVFDGQTMAERGEVVVVTVNYRLGQLGFLAHPLLSAEDHERRSSGNYGLLDQIFALQWVSRNIANFGGDPTNVTIFGESAGGLNVSCLVASPEASGLFHRAIVQSGGFFVSRPLRDNDPKMESAEEFGQRFEERIGCISAGDPIACMRRKSVKEVLSTLPGVLPFLGGCEGDDCVSYGPNIDSAVLTDSPVLVMLRGQHNNVPMIIGTNKNEGSLFIQGIPLSTEEEYRAVVEQFFPTISEQVLRLYPSPTTGVRAMRLTRSTRMSLSSVRRGSPVEC